MAGIECLPYHVKGGAPEQTHSCVENAIWYSHAVYEGLVDPPDIRPNLAGGHSGFLSTVFLRELYDCPIINYFEYYYRTVEADMDYRPDFPYPAVNRPRAHARNTNILLD